MDILEKLQDEGVVEFEIVDGKLRITECCDQYYYLDLTQTETQELIYKLIDLKDKLTK